MIINEDGVRLNDEVESNIEEESIAENTEAKEEKPEMDLLDLLLNSDTSKFKVKERKVEIPRLSEALGTKFVITLKMLPVATHERIMEKMNSVKFDEDGIPSLEDNTEEGKISILVEACHASDGRQIFKNTSLMRKFNVRSNKALIRAMLTPGEISKLYQRYRELTGYVKTSVEDIKN